jgi:hypothetical protein
LIKYVEGQCFFSESNRNASKTLLARRLDRANPLPLPRNARYIAERLMAGINRPPFQQAQDDAPIECRG